MTVYIGIDRSQAKHDVRFLDEADVPIVRSSIHRDGNHNDNAWPNLVLMPTHGHDQAHGTRYQRQMTLATKSRVSGKPCAVSRTERIATRGGRSSGQMTPRRTTDLDPKGRGDKSMSVKQGAAEDVYAAALQRLSDMAKAGLPESQSPGVEPYIRR